MRYACDSDCNSLLDLGRPRSSMGSGALVACIRSAHTCRWSETGSHAEGQFRTGQCARGTLWIPDQDLDTVTDGRKRMLERLRLVVLLDLVDGRLQEHLRLDRAHGALPCDGAKEPCGRHGRVAVDGIGLTELIWMDHVGRGTRSRRAVFRPRQEADVQAARRGGPKSTARINEFR